ncbi:hypothetical protein CNY89_29495, partial [Amaricoccus sp. HAR-UPW-R2A-40]
NLAYVMPELDAAARDRIARETGDNFGRSFLEIFNVPKFRRRIEANLAYVMPELDAAARDRIARETGDNFGRSFLEIF